MMEVTVQFIRSDVPKFVTSAETLEVLCSLLKDATPESIRIGASTRFQSQRLLSESVEGFVRDAIGNVRFVRN